MPRILVVSDKGLYVLVEEKKGASCRHKQSLGALEKVTVATQGAQDQFIIHTKGKDDFHWQAPKKQRDEIISVLSFLKSGLKVEEQQMGDLRALVKRSKGPPMPWETKGETLFKQFNVQKVARSGWTHDRLLAITNKGFYAIQGDNDVRQNPVWENVIKVTSSTKLPKFIIHLNGQDDVFFQADAETAALVPQELKKAKPDLELVTTDAPLAGLVQRAKKIDMPWETKGETVASSNLLEKINRSGGKHDRCLVVTNKAVYIVVGDEEVRHTYVLDALQRVSISCIVPQKQFVMHLHGGDDLHWSAPTEQRDSIVASLKEAKPDLLVEQVDQADLKALVKRL